MQVSPASRIARAEAFVPEPFLRLLRLTSLTMRNSATPPRPRVMASLQPREFPRIGPGLHAGVARSKRRALGPAHARRSFSVVNMREAHRSEGRHRRARGAHAAAMPAKASANHVEPDGKRLPSPTEGLFHFRRHNPQRGHPMCFCFLKGERGFAPQASDGTLCGQASCLNIWLGRDSGPAWADLLLPSRPELPQSAYVGPPSEGADVYASDRIKLACGRCTKVRLPSRQQQRNSSLCEY